MTQTAPSVSAPFLGLRRHYESCFARHGDCARGVDWPDEQGARQRYKIMADLMHSPGSVLDFGCGLGHFLTYLQETGRGDLPYRGLDISDLFITECRRKFPGIPFDCVDILAPGAVVPKADYIVANGVFTERREASQEDMFAATTEVLTRLFDAAGTGLAFNLMSKHVDWERDDLFHVSYDQIADFVTRRLSRQHVIRADYRLYEYTVYVYRSEPQEGQRG